MVKVGVDLTVHSIYDIQHSIAFMNSSTLQVSPHERRPRWSTRVVNACRLDLLRVANHCLHLLALLGQAVIG